MDKVRRLEGFIGDIIKSEITADHLPSVMDRSLIEEAKREAAKYLSKKREYSGSKARAKEK